MSVTPCGRLSCAQPDSSAPAGSASAPAAAVRASRASVLRIVISLCLAARSPALTGCVAKNPRAAPPLHRPRRTSLPGGRLVHAANHALQAQRQSAALLFGQKAPQLALATVRLYGESARMQACGGAAKFNLRPMPREHEPLMARALVRFDGDVGVRHGDGLGVEAALERDLERPGEECHLEARERQDRPEALEREEAAHAEGNEAGAGEEDARAAHGERAVWADLDRERRGVHGDGRMVARGRGDSNQAEIPAFSRAGASRAAASPSTSERALAGANGTIASGGAPSRRVSVARLSVSRSIAAPVRFATQPAKGTPCASMARRVSSAWFRHPSLSPTTRSAGTPSARARSPMLSRGLIGASQPPAPSITTRSERASSALKPDMIVPISISILTSSAAI